MLCERFERELKQQREEVTESAKESTTTGVGLVDGWYSSGGGSDDGATVANATSRRCARPERAQSHRPSKMRKHLQCQSLLVLQRRQGKRRSGRRWRMHKSASSWIPN